MYNVPLNDGMTKRQQLLTAAAVSVVLVHSCVLNLRQGHWLHVLQALIAALLLGANVYPLLQRTERVTQYLRFEQVMLALLGGLFLVSLAGNLLLPQLPGSAQWVNVGLDAVGGVCCLTLAWFRPLRRYGPLASAPERRRERQVLLVLSAIILVPVGLALLGGTLFLFVQGIKALAAQLF